MEATLRISQMEVAALEEVGELEIAEAKAKGVEWLKESVAVAMKEAADTEALSQARVMQRQEAERTALEALADAERSTIPGQ